MPNVTCQRGRHTVFDGAQNAPTRFIRENTTTLVRVVWNRQEGSKPMNVKDSSELM